MLLPSDTNAPKDFEFILGCWRVKHRRLKNLFSNSNHWIEFNGESSTVNTLGGFGNVEDNHLHFPDASIRAKAIRSYNSNTKEWSIWWLDGRSPSRLETPVIGKFSNGIGYFYADDTYNGKSIKVRFIWDSTLPNTPKWEQAFSNDNGKTWETNWTMEFNSINRVSNA